MKFPTDLLCNWKFYETRMHGFLLNTIFHFINQYFFFKFRVSRGRRSWRWWEKGREEGEVKWRAKGWDKGRWRGSGRGRKGRGGRGQSGRRRFREETNQGGWQSGKVTIREGDNLRKDNKRGWQRRWEWVGRGRGRGGVWRGGEERKGVRKRVVVRERGSEKARVRGMSRSGQGNMVG